MKRNQQQQQKNAGETPVRIGMRVMLLDCPGDPATGRVVAIGSNGVAMITDGGGNTEAGALWVVEWYALAIVPDVPDPAAWPRRPRQRPPVG